MRVVCVPVGRASIENESLARSSGEGWGDTSYTPYPSQQCPHRDTEKQVISYGGGYGGTSFPHIKEIVHNKQKRWCVVVRNDRAPTPRP